MRIDDGVFVMGEYDPDAWYRDALQAKHDKIIKSYIRAHKMKIAIGWAVLAIPLSIIVVAVVLVL